MSRPPTAALSRATRQNEQPVVEDIRLLGRILGDVEPRKLRLKQVAQDCGFSGTRQLSVIFERFAGVPLREYAARFHAPRRPASDS